MAPATATVQPPPRVLLLSYLDVEGEICVFNAGLLRGALHLGLRAELPPSLLDGHGGPFPRNPARAWPQFSSSQLHRLPPVARHLLTARSLEDTVLSRT